MRVLIWRDESIEFVNDLHNDGDSDDNEYDFNDKNEDVGHNQLKNLLKTPIVFNTPFGMVSSSDPDNILFEKQMFSGHTNFYIDANVLKKLINVPGVDGLRIMSPYSFAVCVGMCFSHVDVLLDIERVLEIDNMPEDPEFEEAEFQVEEIVKNNEEIIKIATSDLANESFWYVYIMPNGEVITEKFKDGEEMEARTDFFIELSCLSGGILLSSIDT